MIGGFVFHVFSNAVAILAAAYFIAGFNFTGNFLELVVTATVLTVINTFLKPIMKLFLGPLIVITFGLFLIIVNALTLYLLDIWSAPLNIVGYEALLWGTLLIGAVNILIGWGAKFFYKRS
jgi:putative membrane protein